MGNRLGLVVLDEGQSQVFGDLVSICVGLHRLSIGTNLKRRHTVWRDDDRNRPGTAACREPLFVTQRPLSASRTRALRFMAAAFAESYML